jgi:hypothetical protein
LGCSSWAESRLQVTLIGVVPCVEKQIAKGARFAPAGNWRHDHRFCNVLAFAGWILALRSRRAAMRMLACCRVTTKNRLLLFDRPGSAGPDYLGQPNFRNRDLIPRRRPRVKKDRDQHPRSFGNGMGCWACRSYGNVRFGHCASEFLQADRSVSYVPGLAILGNLGSARFLNLGTWL